MKDRLELLRSFCIQQKPVKQKDAFLYFDSDKVALKAETAWFSKKTQKRYDLGSLWLFLDHKKNNTRYINYLSKVNELQLSIISNLDQDEILQYFSGKIDQTDDIDVHFVAQEEALIEKKVRC